MNKFFRLFTLLIVLLTSNMTVKGQTKTLVDNMELDSVPTRFEYVEIDQTLKGDSIYVNSILGDTVWVRKVKHAPSAMYQATVFDGWHTLGDIDFQPSAKNVFGNDYFQWLNDLENSYLFLKKARQSFMTNNPDMVRYNVDMLPKRPENYNQAVEGVAEKIEIAEVAVQKGNVSEMLPPLERLKWLQDFNASVQFSQAYISPNWYQGGNSNLIMLVNALYKVRLNQKFYPKLLFETTIGYKLGVNTVPDDSIHNYSVSEDLFQINSTFGYKAAKRWYYSVNLQFKTQFLNSYNSNSMTLRSAFLSPAELNIGAGMTYDYTNPKGTFSFKASIDPISWQLMACINNKMNATAFDIPEGKKWTNKSGSSLGYNMTWNMTYNIVYTSRLFIFTDYKLFRADWEHKLAFNINRFLTTNIAINMRYDTDTPYTEGAHWKKFQMKEILSFGVAYTFSNTVVR